MTLIYDENALVVAERSLRVLRDALAERINHRIVVVEIPSNDAHCGYLIIDGDNNEAVFTGIGFRTDRKEEGGAGFRSAQALFALYGIMPCIWDEKIAMDDNGNGSRVQIRRRLYQLLEDVKRDYVYDYKGFVKPVDNKPCYIRG